MYSLFGIKNSNRNFSLKESWGKNQFNSSFPAALCNYMESKDIKANYINLKDDKISVDSISIKDAFGFSPSNKNIFFSFEDIYLPYEKYCSSLPRVDLVIKDTKGNFHSGLEIKLTAIPDNSTCDLNENKYSPEIVVRPDTIVYLACSLADTLGKQITQYFKKNKIVDVKNWSNPDEVKKHVPRILNTIEEICLLDPDSQKVILLQPIWKTKGKSSQLAKNCLDVFFWSDAALGSFIRQIGSNDPNKINRQTRSSVWLYKMLIDIYAHGKFDQKKIIDSMSFNTKNDKAFAASGKVTHKYMKSKRLTNPIIKKTEIKRIILNGGENQLSPERRFDAVIVNDGDIFSESN